MSYLKLKKEESWIHIALNRPEKKNALNLGIIQELQEVFKNLSSHSGGVILSGEGDVFCAGADLNWIQNAPALELEQMFDLLNKIRNLPLPVIAHAHALVYGGGIGLLSVCDFVSAESSSRFCFSEARLGLIPAMISFFVSPNFRPWMLNSMPFGVDIAFKNHLIHYEGSQKECLEWRKNLIFHLDQIPLAAYQDNKSFLQKVGTLSLDEVKKEALSCLEKRQQDPMTQEKITHLLNKKKL